MKHKLWDGLYCGLFNSELYTVEEAVGRGDSFWKDTFQKERGSRKNSRYTQYTLRIYPRMEYKDTVEFWEKQKKII